VLALREGLYPMLVAVRLRTGWSKLSVSFAEASDEEIQRGRELQAQRQKLVAKQNESRSAETGPAKEPALLRKASAVVKAERGDWFWVIDRELAEAWRKLHEPRPELAKARESTRPDAN
jgi:hypothetical protein